MKASLTPAHLQAPYVLYTGAVSVLEFHPSPSLLHCRDVTVLLLALKSAVNFIVYCWFSERFWATLKAAMAVCSSPGTGGARGGLGRADSVGRGGTTRTEGGSYYSLKAQSTCVQVTSM